ncbi:alpha/beta fold hydrolase [Streptomyces sp. NPDC056749]|uniref:alpha/beta fold hydrolase n=1 Tax=Streptomyces sp. NPDC056749 TaxID=3345936 RepID=UPI00367FF5F3
MEHIRPARAKQAFALAVLLPTVGLMAAGPSLASESGGGVGADGVAKPTVVLVHGAWADASGWSKVVESLQAQGYPVVAAANPLRGLAADSAYLTARLKTIKGPVVLVGHSYGGAVITNAAVGNSNVKSLVYVAGFAPDKGESVQELVAKYPGSRLTDDPQAPVPTALNAVPFGSSPTDVDLYIKGDKFSDVFLSNRLSTSQANVLAASQRPATPLTVSEPSNAAAWKTIPSWALVSTDDRTIGTQNLRYMAKRAGSTTVEVDAPHAVLETNSDDVTELIVKAAGNPQQTALADTGTTEITAMLSGGAALAITGGAVLVARARRT